MRKIAFWLSLLLIFAIPWEAMVFIDSLGTVGRATGLLVAAFWVVTVVVTGRFRRPHLFHVAVYGFLVWNLVSVFWSVDIDRTVDRMLTYVQLAVLVLILWDLYRSPAALKAGLQAYVLGAYVSIVSTVANYLAAGDSGPERVAATGFNENDLGLILALGIPVAWYLATSEHRSKASQVLRIINYAYVPAAMLAIVLTGSRGALVAALPGLLFVLSSFTRLKPYLRVAIFVALVGSLLALQPLVPESSLERFSTIAPSIAEGDLTGREGIWHQGFVALSEHPLTGIGSGAFRAAVESGKVAHNVFLSVLVEVGPIGLVLFAIMLAIVVREAIRQPKWESRLWLAVLLVWALGATVHTWEQTKPTWLFLGLVIVSADVFVRPDESLTRAARQSQTLQVATNNQGPFLAESSPLSPSSSTTMLGGPR